MAPHRPQEVGRAQEWPFGPLEPTQAEPSHCGLDPSPSLSQIANWNVPTSLISCSLTLPASSASWGLTLAASSAGMLSLSSSHGLLISLPPGSPPCLTKPL